MNASLNHGLQELDQFDFAENSISSILRALFKSRGPEGAPNPSIDSALDRSFETANMAQEGNFPGSSGVLDDFEYDVAGWTSNSLAIDLEPLAGIMDESLVQNIDDIPIYITLPLVDYSCKDAPTISKSLDLDSYRKNSNIGSNIVSAIAHLVVIFAFVLSNPTGSIGQHGNSQNPIFVRLIDPNSLIVQQSSLASVDSAASCPSIAKRSKGETGQIKKESHNNPDKSVQENDEGKAPAYSEGNNDKATKNEKDVKFVEQTLSPSKAFTKNDDVNLESLSMMDSVASQASTASKENRSAAPQ
ncbi:MAG: hypothetical protein V1897_01580, partial [Pseudomonadota bacterium]